MLIIWCKRSHWKLEGKKLNCKEKVAACLRSFFPSFLEDRNLSCLIEGMSSSTTLVISSCQRATFSYFYNFYSPSNSLYYFQSIFLLWSFFLSLCVVFCDNWGLHMPCGDAPTLMWDLGQSTHLVSSFTPLDSVLAHFLTFSLSHGTYIPDAWLVRSHTQGQGACQGHAAVFVHTWQRYACDCGRGGSMQ